MVARKSASESASALWYPAPLRSPSERALEPQQRLDVAAQRGADRAGQVGPQGRVEVAGQEDPEEPALAQSWPRRAARSGE